MNTALLTFSAFSVTAMAVSHAVLGEHRLVRPLLRSHRGIMQDKLTRSVFRLAWHLTTGLMLLTAALLFFAAQRPTGTDPRMVAAIGSVYFGAGIVDCIATKGRHDAWLPLIAVGLLILFV